MRFRSFEEALDYLYSFIDYETRRTTSYTPENYNLLRVTTLLEKAGYRQTFRVVHVAGTKGKGSVSSLAAASFSALGYTTGLFASPHILCVNERIQLNGAHISDDAFMRRIGFFADIVDMLDDAMRPTTFELFTAIALYHFMEEKADIAVIETGMGGRLDSTNIVSPSACVIASISYDHMDKLGDTLSLIAKEKAGIIKEGVPVITGEQRRSVMRALRAAGREKKAPFILSRARRICASKEGASFVYSALNGTRYRFSLALLGGYQAENAALALRAVDITLGITDEGAARIYNALSSFVLPARLHIASRAPFIIVDGAHNEDSLRKNITALLSLFPERALTILFAPLADKDINGMAKALRRAKARVIVSAPFSHKRVDAKQTRNILAHNGVRAELEEDFAKAVRLALTRAQEENALLFITGSLYAASAYYALSGGSARSGFPNK